MEEDGGGREVESVFNIAPLCHQTASSFLGRGVSRTFGAFFQSMDGGNLRGEHHGAASASAIRESRGEG